MLNRVIATFRILAMVAADDLRGASAHERSHRARRIGLLLAASVLAAVALTASAAEPPRPTDPLYNVELVILRPVTPIGVPEDWSVEARHALAPATASEADEEASPSSSPTTGGRMAVRTLSTAQYRLSGIDAALARSKGYELIRHVGWTQAPTPRGAGLAVELADIASDSEPLRGTVALERGRYLHLRLDLAYVPATPPNSLLGAVAASGPVTFTLRQNRRVKAFERHYFDHPAFGVIAMVSPVGGRPPAEGR
jgi:hypothetical protein